MNNISATLIKEILISAVVRCQITLNSLFLSVSSLVIDELLIVVIGLSMLLKIDIFHLLHLIEVIGKSLEIKSVFYIAKLEKQVNYAL